MKKIKLDSGLELEIQDTAMNNMEMLDDLVDLEDGNPASVSRIIRRLLTPAGKKALYEQNRGEDGRVTIDSMTVVLKEIFNKLGDSGKN